MGYVEELRKIVGHRPLILTGSIVIILNKHNEILLQQRTYPYGVWGLPGGLMELAESAEDCARREVWEETGLVLGELRLVTVSSGKNHYVKAENGDEFYVVTIVYTTEDYTHNQPLVHNDESIQLRYFPANQLPKQMVGSHRNAIIHFLASH